jgi:hypothetical protein
VINPGWGFTFDGAIEIGWGNPNRAVPRVTTIELRTRRSTGTSTGDGAGGAARAAASDGDTTCRLTNQPAAAAAVANAITPIRTTVFLLAMMPMTQTQQLSYPRTWMYRSDLDLRNQPSQLITVPGGDIYSGHSSILIDL